MTKLTNRTVQAAQDDADGRDVVLWDEDLPGFGLRLRPPYGRFYIVQYRNALGRSRKLTLGRVGVLTPVEARKLAREKLAAVALGTDPAAARDTARDAITVGDLCAEYLEAEERAKRIKASTLRMDRSRIERHVKPLLGRRHVQGVTTADLEKFMTSVIEGKTAQKVKGKRPRGGIASGGRGVASRTMSMLHAVLQRAVRHGVIDKNPATGIRRPKDVERKPPFSFEAVKRLGLAISEMEAEGENQIGLFAIRLLLLTGCRRMEVLTLRRDQVDAHGHCFRLADTKSGPQVRPVGLDVLELIKARTELETAALGEGEALSAYVMPGNSKAGHFIGLPRVWLRVAQRAKIDGVSLHGLRHWFAGAATELNFSELTIAGLLGHRVKGVTARYATAPDRALTAAADAVAAALMTALNNADASARDRVSNVLPLRRAR